MARTYLDLCKDSAAVRQGVSAGPSDHREDKGVCFLFVQIELAPDFLRASFLNSNDVCKHLKSNRYLKTYFDKQNAICFVLIFCIVGISFRYVNEF